MKKVLIPALVLMSVSTAAMAEVDNRSAWAKSQDMYVEPTLRMKQTQTYTPVDQNNVPTGQTVVTNESVQVYGPNGAVINNNAAPAVQAPVAPAVQAPVVTPAVEAPATQQVQPAIQDLSRPMQ